MLSWSRFVTVINARLFLDEGVPTVITKLYRQRKNDTSGIGWRNVWTTIAYPWCVGTNTFRWIFLMLVFIQMILACDVLLLISRNWSEIFEAYNLSAPNLPPEQPDPRHSRSETPHNVVLLYVVKGTHRYLLRVRWLQRIAGGTGHVPKRAYHRWRCPSQEV